ncbi:MAG: putative PEP-binding protein [Alphaproteobacteria bacterium]
MLKERYNIIASHRRLAASQYPKPDIVRMSDFKTNEYANLVGGASCEPKEENPMIGVCGTSRYYSPLYREGFALECQAIPRMREEMGFTNVILAKAFAERFDGFSIGSNDLTQLTLGVDRDSEALAELFNEQDEAVEWMIENVIRAAHKAGAKVGLCGQAPSDHPEFAEFLVEGGIDSASVSPDSFLAVKCRVAAAEPRVGRNL